MSRQSRFRGDIQGLRAVAVLLVVLGHAGMTQFAGGYVGVDVFFVISGFLITGILARSLVEHGSISIAAFYARRARRILPAAALALVAILIGSSFVYTSGRLHDVLGDTVWATFFSANIHYANAGTGYFDTDSFVSPIQHFWSLAVEEQFYVLWPLLLAGCGLVAHRVVRRRSEKRARVHRIRQVGLNYATVLILAIVVSSLAWSVIRTGTDSQMAYFSTLTRAWELGIGAFLALVTEKIRRWPRPAKVMASWLGLTAIMVAATHYSDSTPFPGYQALLPVVGSAMVLAGGIQGPRYGASLVLDTPPMRFIGDISYSFYLWHWPLLILPAAYLGRALNPWEATGAIVIALGSAWLSYVLVETPVRRTVAFDRNRIKSVLLWPAMASVLVASVLAVSAADNFDQTHEVAYVAPKADPEPNTMQDSPDTLINDVGYSAELARASYALPGQLVPDLQDLHGDVTRVSNDCATGTRDESLSCQEGDPDSTRRIVVLGDSHMGMWLKPISTLARDRGFAIVPLLMQRCMPIDVLQYNENPPGPYTACTEHNRRTMTRIGQLKPERIIISGLYTAELADAASGKKLQNSASNKLFGPAAVRTFQQLKALVPEVFVLGPTPVLPEPAADCLASRRATMAACLTPLRDLVIERDRLLGAAADRTGVHYVSVLPWFCDPSLTCPIVVRNMIVYRDTNHITESYAQRLAPMLKLKLDL